MECLLAEWNGVQVRPIQINQMMQMQQMGQAPVTTAQMLLDMHTKEIEKFYREKQEVSFAALICGSRRTWLTMFVAENGD